MWEQARLLPLQVQERLRTQPRLQASSQLGPLRWRHPRWGHHRFRRRKGYVVVQQNLNKIAAYTTNLWKDWLYLNFVFAQATKRNSPVWTQRWDGAERLRRLEAQAQQETGSRLTSRPQLSFGASGHRYRNYCNPLTSEAFIGIFELHFGDGTFVGKYHRSSLKKWEDLKRS